MSSDDIRTIGRLEARIRDLTKNTTTPWPNDVSLRYLTLGGAHLDVTGSGQQQDYAWHCHGCLQSSDCPDKDYLFRIRDHANEHASICRAMPKPEASQ